MADLFQQFHDIIVKNRNAVAGAGAAGAGGGGIAAMGGGFSRGMQLDQQMAKQQQHAAMLEQQNAARAAMMGENAPAWMQGMPQGQMDYLQANPQLFDKMIAEQFTQSMQPAAKREIMKDASGVNRYVDTGENVFGNMSDYVDPDVAKDKKKSDLETSKFAGTLRKEFTSESKDFKKISQSYQVIQKAGARKSGAGDMSMVFAFMKMLDPTSVVREGEFASARDTAGVPAAIRNQYNKIISGEFLTPDQRQEFIAMAADVYGTQEQKFNDRVNFYTTEAISAGIDPTRIIQDFSKGIKPATSAPTLKIGETIQLNGGTLTKVGN